jgi:hypothetical protein
LIVWFSNKKSSINNLKLLIHLTLFAGPPALVDLAIFLSTYLSS